MGSIVIVALVIISGLIALRGYRWATSAPTKLEKLGYISGLEDAGSREEDVLARFKDSGHPIHRASRSPPSASELSAAKLAETMVKISTLQALLSNSSLPMSAAARTRHHVALEGLRAQLQDLTRSEGDARSDALRFNQLLCRLRGIELDISRRQEPPPTLEA